MHLLRKINFIVVTGLSLIAGLPKLGRVQNEVAAFASAGLGELIVVVFGALQLVGGVLMIPRRTRTWGATLSGLMFFGSAAMLLTTGQVAFGIVSLLPVAMAATVAFSVDPEATEPGQQRIPQ